jgi:hypothetical protein
VSDYGFHEKLRESEEKLLERLGGETRLREILGRLLHPIAGVRKGTLQDDLNGVDRWVDRSGAKSLGVDIKCRERDYDDLLIEFESSSLTHAPGWTIDAAKITDFVLYLFPSRVALVSYPQLRAAAIRFLPDWLDRYHESKNITTTDGGAYRTRWIAVPDRVVYQAMGYQVTGLGPIASVTSARPTGPRCPKCGASPLSSTPGALDLSFVRYRDEFRHEWDGAS